MSEDNEKMLQQIELVLRQTLELDAKQRLSNIKIVNPELYYKVAQFIVQLYESGKLQGKIDDETLKDFLSRINVKREFSFKRK